MTIVPATSLLRVEDVEISSGTSLSAAVDLTGIVLCAIIMPAAWTTAVLTFQSADPLDATTFKDLYDEFGTERTVQAAASRYIYLDPADWAGVRRLKVRSGTTGSAVNQAADRTVQLVGRPI